MSMAKDGLSITLSIAAIVISIFNGYWGWRANKQAQIVEFISYRNIAMSSGRIVIECMDKLEKGKSCEDSKLDIETCLDILNRIDVAKIAPLQIAEWFVFVNVQTRKGLEIINGKNQNSSPADIKGKMEVGLKKIDNYIRSIGFSPESTEALEWNRCWWYDVYMKL